MRVQINHPHWDCAIYSETIVICQAAASERADPNLFAHVCLLRLSLSLFASFGCGMHVVPKAIY